MSRIDENSWAATLARHAVGNGIGWRDTVVNELREAAAIVESLPLCKTAGCLYPVLASPFGLCTLCHERYMRTIDKVPA